jgi:hypothetical protein
MKNYKFSFYFLFLISTFSILNAENYSIKRYYTDNGNEIPESSTINIIKSATSSVSYFNTGTNSPICGEIYRHEFDANNNLIKKVYIPTDKILLDFNYVDGTFTCLYKNQNEFGVNKQETIVYKMKNYSLFMKGIDGTTKINISNIPVSSDIYSLFGGTFKPSNLTDLEKVKDGNYDIFPKATKMGLIIPRDINMREDSLETNFTVSQFITGLITLNSDVVEGVEKNGDIIINPTVASKMAIINNSNFTGTILKDKLKDFITNVNPFTEETGNNVENGKAIKAYSSANSFEEYFDKKLFGLYYNFMNIAWGSLFNYAGLSLLSMMIMYSVGIVSFKFVLHRLNEKNKNKDFEFPFVNRIVAIAATLVLSFIPYSTGKGSYISYGDDKSEIIQAQTTIAKSFIGFLSNAGANIADIGASSSIVVYLDYLMKATNTQSYSDTVATINAHRRNLVQQAIIQGFFKDNCAGSYKTQFSNINSFQDTTSHQDVRWSIIDNNWLETKSPMLFSSLNNGEESKISPLLCKKLEANLVFNKKLLTAMQINIEKNIKNLGKNNLNIFNANTSHTTMSQLYVDTQLESTHMLGWISASTLPLSHIFMLNSNIIDNGFDGATTRSTTSAFKGSTTTSMLLNRIEDNYTTNKNKNSLDTLNIESPKAVLSGNLLNSMLTEAFSMQVYMMLPAFESIRNILEKMLHNSFDLIVELILKFAPSHQFNFLMSVINFVSNQDIDTSTISTDDKNNIFDKNNNRIGKISYSLNGISELLILISSLFGAVYIYKLMLASIFASLVTLLAVLKIVLYFFDVFIHYFISPLIVGWKMTINDRTDKVHGYIVDGFILYLFKPTLIVFSMVMFILSYEILISIYSMIFDLAFSSLELADSFYKESGFLSYIIMGSIKGFAEVFVYILGMILAYFIILKGDTMILNRFGYKDDNDAGIVHQLGERIQNIASTKI